MLNGFLVDFPYVTKAKAVEVIAHFESLQNSHELILVHVNREKCQASNVKFLHLTFNFSQLVEKIRVNTRSVEIYRKSNRCTLVRIGCNIKRLFKLIKHFPAEEQA